MKKLGFKPRLQPEAKLMDGINAGRITIPHAQFDAARCAKGLDCLREYKAEWDAQARVFRKAPAHDWASHGADAWRGLSLSWREPVPAEEAKPIRGTLEMTMDEAWQLAMPKRPSSDGRI
jgi:phage terminase large subunit